MSSPSPDRRSCLLGPLSLAGLLVFVSMATICAQWCFSRTADDADWERAAAAAVEIAEPTDAIRVHPAWLETPLPHLQPVGNLLHRQQFPLLEELRGIDRFLILSESRLSDDAVERLPFDATAEEIHSFDTVDLLEVTVPETMRVTSDFTDLLGDATVSYIDSDGDVDDCRRRPGDAGEWRCDGGRNAGTIRPTLLEVEHEPRRCIQAYPPSDDRFLSIEMTVDDPADILRIRAGLDNRAARIYRGDDVEYRLYVDDELVADERIDGHTSKWTPHDVPTGESDGAPVAVRLEVESVTPDPHHRRFCFNGWSLTAGQVQNSNR